ncbi:sigma-70 family RNA polymerase sigma factor [Galactobacter valiniphilus]|uniref:Sigma-70 family RNA polymerase sigma factor n=1 Tax=Galactobacter valiniphilus TaxID=2676122 RepID=A0A399JAD0_9MICC|nr:sigma-70 family RNA polymerase sigma factor [Galactobacter valiniphilus]RII41159.1 sigma-70 family RNA polymerase sigma factor [Galactobacter valiniphilus]
MTEEWGITKTSSAYERAIPDSELLRATRGGDVEMFEVLWQRYSGQLLGYARKRVPAHQAEDAVSEVLLSTLRAILNGSGPDRFFRAYAFQSLRHALGRQHEAAQLTPLLDHEDLERVAPAAERPRSEDAMLVNTLLAEFDDETQLLLRLNLEEGRRISEIAETLSLAPEVASRRLYEAKDVFRAKWFAAHLDLAGAEPECMAAMALAPHAFGRSAGGAKSR